MRIPVKVIYPGTFDPLTLGHLDIINRASGLFDEVLIAVAHNVSKSPLFSLNQRVSFIEIAVTQVNCQVLPFDGLLVDFMKQHHTNIMIRGARTAGDYDYESRIFHVNKLLQPDLDVILFPARVEFQDISSTFVRDMIKFGGNLEKFVPKCIVNALRA